MLVKGLLKLAWPWPMGGRGRSAQAIGGGDASGGGGAGAAGHCRVRGGCEGSPLNGAAGGAPVLRTLTLGNFMCHRHFQIDFGRVTVIAGRNGSGKSAIMVALGTLFGLRAAGLDRGNFKDLIKTGANQAIIRAELSNATEYRVAHYGPLITVEKQIRAHTTRLLISDANGRMRPATAGELHELIEALRLKIDNPLVFLTQEMSKRLLTASSPARLYELYYNGTELRTIQDSLLESGDRLAQMSRRIEEAAAKHSVMRAALSEHEEQLRFLGTDYDALRRGVAVERAVWRVASAAERWAAARDHRARATAAAAQLEAQHAAAATAVPPALVEPDEHLEAAAQAAARHLREIEEDLREYSEDLQRCKANLAGAQGLSREAAQAQLAAAETRAQHAEAQAQSAAAAEEAAAAATAQAAAAAEAHRNRAYALRKQLEFLRSSAQDASTAATERLYAAIAKEIAATRFESEVIGPLCKHVALRDQRWFKAVSIILKKSLSSYLVFSRNDRQRLLAILKRVGAPFSVHELSSRHVIREYTRPECGPETPTLLDVLDLKNEYVQNQLILLHSAEQIVMVREREAAYALVRAQHRGVDCAYTPQGDRVRLVNGSLSDFKARDDGKYWFEDRQSRVASAEQALAEHMRTAPEDPAPEAQRARAEAAAARLAAQRAAAELSAARERLACASADENTQDGRAENTQRLHAAERTIAALQKRRTAAQLALAAAEAARNTAVADAERQNKNAQLKYAQTRAEALRLQQELQNSRAMAPQSEEAVRTAAQELLTSIVAVKNLTESTSLATAFNELSLTDSQQGYSAATHLAESYTGLCEPSNSLAATTETSQYHPTRNAKRQRCTGRTILNNSASYPHASSSDNTSIDELNSTTNKLSPATEWKRDRSRLLEPLLARLTEMAVHTPEQLSENESPAALISQNPETPTQCTDKSLNNPPETTQPSLLGTVAAITPLLRPPRVLDEADITFRESSKRAAMMRSHAETEQDVTTIRAELAHLSRIRDHYESLLRETIHACELRRAKRDEVKERATRAAQKAFASLLARGGYAGELIIQHGTAAEPGSGRLELCVHVHGQDTAGAQTTLSGGERSFAAVCLLLAMWRVFWCPLKVLDEFDVFMDPVNRARALEMLFEELRASGTQAILITPLDMGAFAGQDCAVRWIEKINE